MKQKHPMLSWLSLSALLLSVSTAGAGSTPAGTEIPNTATANYTSPTGTPTTSTGNTVSTTALGICSTKVEANTSALTLIPGDTGTFAYTVTNTGNGPSSVSLTPTVPVGSYKLYDDANGNGVLDAGEPEITAPVALSAGQAEKVLVVVSTAVANAAGSYTVSLAGACGNGDSSVANSSLTLTDKPSLVVKKSFNTAVLKPGDDTTVTINTVNNGGDSHEVVVTDPLSTLITSGLVFDGGATASVGTVEYSTDGTTWSATQPIVASSVKSIRVRVGTLVHGASVNLSFKMKALASAEGQSFINVATAATTTGTTSDDATLEVKYGPSVAIWPVDTAYSINDTPADMQTKPFAVVGDTVCFSHTVQNTGNVDDTFTFAVTYPAGQANATIKDASGNTITSLPLAAGASATVQVCYDLTTAGSLNALVTVKGTRGTSNPTTDTVTVIEAGKPGLVKTSDAPATTVLAQSSDIHYTLTITNPYNRPLTNVVVSDKLPTHMDYVSSDNGGVASGGVGTGNAGATVTWNLSTIAPNSSVDLHIAGKVNAQAQDGEHIDNTFSLTSTEFPTPLTSNLVSTVVWDPAKLDIQKDVNNTVASMGDALTYTVVVTNNAVTALSNTSITDLPAPGLAYIAGSSTLDDNAFADPTADAKAGTLTWNNVGAMAPGQQHKITYKMRVTPAVSGDLVNTVYSTALTADSNKVVRSVKSSYKSRTVRPLTPNMAAISDIVGLVYVDRNRNGLFDKYLDTPVERARVILAGGRLALTDKDGRYHFANVKSGTQALRLDPNTTPYNPLNIPQSQGLSGTQTVYARGLTSVDFPLAPVGGDITAIRRTSLDVGDVHVQKVVYHTDQGYVVAMTIDTPKPLENFVLQDPLPAGATLQEGRNTLEGTLPTGKTVVNYRFAFNGGDEAAVTDPNVVWRY